jgi:hypothetical protein
MFALPTKTFQNWHVQEIYKYANKYKNLGWDIWMEETTRKT